MNKKVLSFGELLLRICPGGDWLRDNSLPFYIGGAEANVATALALWGLPSVYFTVVPDNAMTREISEWLEEKGVDISRILYQGERLGLYYLPQGKDLKNAGVIYDRAHSSFSALKPGVIDWDAVLRDIGWLHFSAISPALNSCVAAVCTEMLQAATQKGITISVDLNYRAKLWQYGVAPTDVMPALTEYCHLVMGNLWAAEKMLGIPVDTSLVDTDTKKDYLEHAWLTSEQIMQNFPNVRFVANTFRFDHGEKGIRYYTSLYTEKTLYHSKEYISASILDKVGSGDCYIAGLIYGLHRGRPVQDTLEFATAAAYQKLFIPSDATNQPAEVIEKFMHSYER
ncbi:sugar kinase [Puia dinghuensis]|uniref:2-dehydro-3-deoxygluconokinase n=1 Tax=Puia dinghuensis TaxID=1792502 RepID=A0A8J2XTX7_9BACT|nr:sugar kinase [Puia dinghuensis]GGB21330.1 2-dehydro-3-deoxygluconokinase [Puia dinghuensis]